MRHSPAGCSLTFLAIHVVDYYFKKASIITALRHTVLPITYNMK